MFRVIGVIAVVGFVGFGVAHYTGHLKLSGDVDVTQKGHSLMEEGIDGAQSLTNKGFDALRTQKEEHKRQAAK